MPLYSCAYDGMCELDEYGTYSSEEACQIECQGIENKETTYITHSYNPRSAMELAPSDRVRVIKEIVGAQYQDLLENSYDILEDIANRNLWTLQNYDVDLGDYVKNQKTALDVIILSTLGEYNFSIPVDYKRLRAIIRNGLLGLDRDYTEEVDVDADEIQVEDMMDVFSIISPTGVIEGRDRAALYENIVYELPDLYAELRS
jgi:hypothetical protein